MRNGDYFEASFQLRIRCLVLTYRFNHFCCVKAEEEETRRHIVLAKPISLEDEKDSEHTASNVIRRYIEYTMCSLFWGVNYTPHI